MADRTDNPTALAALRAASETIDDLMSVVDELHHATYVHRRHAVWASASGSGHMLRQARRVRHRLADTIVRLQR